MNRDLQGLWIARLARDPLLVSRLLLPVWCVGARTRFLMTHCTIPTLVNVFAGNLIIYMQCTLHTLAFLIVLAMHEFKTHSHSQTLGGSMQKPRTTCCGSHGSVQALFDTEHKLQSGLANRCTQSTTLHCVATYRQHYHAV